MLKTYPAIFHLEKENHYWIEFLILKEVQVVLELKKP